MVIRITNVTHRNSPAGEILDLGEDFKNHLVGAGRSWQGDVGESIPQFILNWAERGKIQIFNALDGRTIHEGPGDITPGLLHASVPSQLTGEDNLDEDEPDLNQAVEARVPEHGPARSAMGAHSPSTQQVHKPAPQHRAKVSLGETETEEGSQDIAPIPGERVRNTDDSDKFTVRAPRAHGPGAVISGTKR